MSYKFFPKLFVMLLGFYFGSIAMSDQVLADSATYKITATAGKHGIISPSGVSKVALDATPTYTFTPDSGYVIASVKVDGKQQSIASTYTFAPVTSNQTITVTFVLSSYSIKATAGANGTISPSGTNSVNYLTTPTYTFTPNLGYKIATITVDGKKKTVASTYTFAPVKSNQTISVTFALATSTYKITATAGKHGSISPSGVTKVAIDATPTYTFTPDSGYVIDTIKVDGKKQSIASTYTFAPVTSNQTISVTFALATSTYKITATAGKHGSISPSGVTKVAIDATPTYTFTPDSGYVIDTIKVDGKKQSIASTYTFAPVTSNQTISVTFALATNTYEITATAGVNGSISPSGTSTVALNATPTYTITPNTGYQIATITVDGVNQPVASSYTFAPVTSNQTISVTFSVSTLAGNVYTITATAGSNGSISPSGTSTVALNATPIYTITPNAGYQIATITVDGLNQPIASTYTFAPVSSDQTISVTFVVDPSTAINAFLTNAIGNAYNVNSGLLSAAVAQINSLQQSDYNAYITALTLLVNDLTTLANDAIAQYTTTPNSTNLQIAINDVTLLQPYNSVLINGVGAYDNSVDLLAEAVTNVLANNNDIQYYFSTDSRFNTDNSFASDVAIDASGNTYVSAPSDSSTGFGAIYEISQPSSAVITITPVSPIEGDHFGRLFAVSGNTLIASSEPADGQAQVYVFTFQNNQWVQQTILDLTALTNIAQIHQITLALSGTSIAVGLPEYGEYLVFDQNTVANTPVNNIWQLDLQGSLTANNSPVAESMAAEGSFIVIGAPVTTGSFVRILDQTAGDSTHIYNWSSTDIQSNNAGFGTSVSITGSTSASAANEKLTPIRLYSITQVAVGSPKENNGNGAAYILTGSTSLSTNVTTWSSPQPVSLLTNSSTTLAGSEIAINNGMLLVGANPGVDMVYKLNTNNQWVWAFTNGPAQYVSNSLATNGILAIIGVQETSVANCSDYTGSGPCPLSHVDSVQP